MESMINKNIKLYRDIIEAGAIGDAFGYFVEFSSVAAINYRYKNFSWEEVLEQHPVWYISDDTQMTLFALERVIPYMINTEMETTSLISDIFIGYGDWYDTQQTKLKESEKLEYLKDFKEMYRYEAPGNTCLGALSSWQMGTLDYPLNNSKGCGGIMRTAPVAFLELSLEKTFEMGARQAITTHGHPDGYLSAGFFAGLIQALIDDEISVVMDSNCGVFNLLIDITKKYPKHENFVKYVEKVIHYINQPDRLEKSQLNNVLGEGWVGEEALGIAMYCAFKNDNFKDCIVHASYHNGDSDSTASLAAQLFIAKGSDMGDCKEVLSRMPAYPAIEFLFNKITNV